VTAAGTVPSVHDILFLAPVSWAVYGADAIFFLLVSSLTNDMTCGGGID